MLPSPDELASPADNGASANDGGPGVGPLGYDDLAREAETQRTRADNLLVALETSRTIGMAMGILMSRHRVTADAAYEMLRRGSQVRQRKLRDMAEEVVQTGELSQPRVDGVPSEGA